MSKQSRIRYGVVGLGHIAQVAVLPAFRAASKNSELTALVTGDPKKARALSKKYKGTVVYGYDQFEELIVSDAVDALYIALPNHMHLDFAERALRRGLHVLCEKPLALTVEDCRRMQEAAEFSGAKIMTAYRLHFEESNLKALELCKKKKLGELRYFSSNFSYQVKDKKNIRLSAKDGGSPLWDIGIYCLNAARTLFQAEPDEVSAFATTGKDPRFAEVQEMVSATLRFGDRLATFNCSYGADTAGAYEIYGTKGSLRLESAYDYVGPRKLHVLKDGQITQTLKFKQVDQFAAELDYFSKCVLGNKHPEPDAEEGLRDVRAILALLESIESGKSVRLDHADHKGPAEGQATRYRPHREPDLVDVTAPSSSN